MVRVMAMVTAALVVTAACSQTSEEPQGDEGTTASGRIEGTVTDQQGNPLVELRLGITSGTVPFPEIAPVTNPDGFYSFPSIRPGTFEVAVYDIEGNVLRQETVEVRPSETSNLDFSVNAAATLSPLAPTATEVPLSELFGVDLETCEGFLDEPPSNMVAKTREFTDAARQDNESIVSMCQTSQETPDGSASVAATIISFESAAFAEAHFETTLSDLRLNAEQVTMSVVGSESFQAVVNRAGVGSFVVLQEGIYTVQVYTTMPEGQAPLREVEQLVELSSRVKERLP